MKPLRNYVIGGSIAVLLGIATGMTYRHFDARDSSVVRTQASYVTDFSDPRRLVGWADNVFIGRVEAGAGILYTETALPWSLFQVRVSENIKGKLADVVKVGQEGGYSLEEKAVLLMNDDKLLVPGNEYLFVTKKDARGWHTVLPVFGDIQIGASKHRRALTEKFKAAFEEEIPYSPQG